MASRAPHEEMTLAELEQWLWDAACAIRGAVDAPKFKDFILPLIFLKRLSDVFDDELEALAEEFGGAEAAMEFVEADHKLVRFYVPAEARWASIVATASGLGEALTDAVRAVSAQNTDLHGVIDVVDFNATTAGQRIIEDERLAALVQVLSRHKLGLRDVEPDLLGRAYEYLLRKFAEGGGQSGGEFYTPREVAVLMACLLQPSPGMSVCDPCCGSAGLLIKAHLRLLEMHGEGEQGSRRLPADMAPLQMFGQEENSATYALARMNAVIHDISADVRLGDSMRRPRLVDAAGRLLKFDRVTANPMWFQEFPVSVYENDTY